MFKRVNEQGSVGIVLLVILAVILGGLVLSYNSMVSWQKNVDNAYADVEAQLQRRLDLIPNLVETVKGYASHEKDTLNSVVEARTKAKQMIESAKSPKELLEAKALLDNQMSRLFALVEQYPDLKASRNFLALQDQLEGTENRISVARQRYNYAVNIYNKKLRVFPNILIAKMLGFEEKESFEADKSARKAISVKF